MGWCRAVVLFVLTSLSYQSKLSARDGYHLTRRFEEEQVLLHKTWKSSELCSQKILQVPDDKKCVSTVFQSILLSKVPPVKIAGIFDEALAIIYDSTPEGSFEDALSWTGKSMDREYNCLKANMVFSEYNYDEFYALLNTSKYEIRLGNLFLDLELRGFLDEYPEFKGEPLNRLEQYSIALKQGVGFKMLNDLIKEIDKKYQEITHLYFWTTPTGRWLLETEKEAPIKIYPAKYLIDVLSDSDVAHWIYLAYESGSMAMATIMFLFPEKAREIYENANPLDNFKWVFTDKNLGYWRREYAARMDWGEINWGEISFQDVCHVMKGSDQKENERFDLLVWHLAREDTFYRIFGQNYYDRVGFQREYERKTFRCDGPAFFYMKLEQMGYPIDRTPNAVDDELEAKILQHYSKTGIRDGWIVLKMIEIMKVYPYSRYIPLGKLSMEPFKHFASGNDDSLKHHISRLAQEISKLAGGEVAFEIPPDRRLGFYRISEIFDYIEFKGDLACFYSRLISNLKKETDTNSRALLLEILPRFIFRCLGGGIQSLFSRSVKSLLSAGVEDNGNVFDDWSEDLLFLADDVNKIYKLADPLRVFDHALYAYSWELSLSNHKYILLENYFMDYEFTNDFFNDMTSLANYARKQVHENERGLKLYESW